MFLQILKGRRKALAKAICILPVRDCGAQCRIDPANRNEINSMLLVPLVRFLIIYNFFHRF
ncbi:MAG: hypothetical protein A2173_09155 [Planctomycetes bacterium RBG_13_44_8b]|nr:MAG: hypothetical protein A2173_09155 [Planctomycetes bacterium RBG_13_44_8b]